VQKLALLAAVSTALPLCSAGAAFAAAGPGAPSLTLNVLEIQKKFVSTIPGNQRPRFGDRFWFQSELYTWNGTKRGAAIGHTEVIGVLLPSNQVQISAVGFLPGGTVTVVGQTSNGPVSTFAVVGGTGRYATARGEVIVRDLGGPSSNRTSDTIRLWL